MCSTCIDDTASECGYGQPCVWSKAMRNPRAGTRAPSPPIIPVAGYDAWDTPNTTEQSDPEAQNATLAANRVTASLPTDAMSLQQAVFQKVNTQLLAEMGDLAIQLAVEKEKVNGLQAQLATEKEKKSGSQCNLAIEKAMATELKLAAQLAGETAKVHKLQSESGRDFADHKLAMEKVEKKLAAEKDKVFKLATLLSEYCDGGPATSDMAESIKAEPGKGYYEELKKLSVLSGGLLSKYNDFEDSYGTALPDNIFELNECVQDIFLHYVEAAASSTPSETGSIPW